MADTTNDRWPMLRRAPFGLGGFVDSVEAMRALDILDAVTAPGTKVFGIRRFPIDGEDGVWMPEDVAMALAARFGGDDWRSALAREVLGPEGPMGSRHREFVRLAARYGAATAPPPPKWERDLRDSCRCYGLEPAAIDRLIDVTAAALTEEAQHG